MVSHPPATPGTWVDYRDLAGALPSGYLLEMEGLRIDLVEVDNVVAGCGTITRVWTATDPCGNTASATQTITVVDTTAPELVGVPTDETVFCDAIPVAAQVTATDACGGASEKHYKIIAGNFTWAQAKDDAVARGGHLATITSDEEWAAIQQALGEDLNGLELWLGGTDAG